MRATKLLKRLRLGGVLVVASLAFVLFNLGVSHDGCGCYLYWEERTSESDNHLSVELSTAQLQTDVSPQENTGEDQSQLLVGRDSQSKAWKWYGSDNTVFSAKKGPALPPPISTGVPRVMYFIWCGTPYNESYFEFKHFLSIKSAIHFLNPDTIYLYYAEHPVEDKLHYNTWLDELLDTFPFIICKTLTERKLCGLDDTPRWGSLVRVMNMTGGIYMALDIILTAPLPGLVEGHLAQAWSVTGEITLASVPTSITVTYDPAAMARTGELPVHTLKCVSMEAFSDGQTAPCVDTPRNVSLFPQDFFTGEDSFSTLVRTVFYGKPDVPELRPHGHDVVPRIANYYWFGGGEMKFIFYLSVLSCLHVIKLKAVYIHGDKPPSGEHWQKFQNEPRVQWIHRFRSDMIYATRTGSINHWADVAGMDGTIKYGGINCDPDLIFTRKFDPVFWRYDAMASPSQSNNDPYPQIINYGLRVARPRAEFWWMAQRAQRDYKDKEYNYNAARQLYKIYERNPHLLKLDPRLQVMCWHGMCIPRWVKSRIEGIHFNRNISDWMDTVYSFHYTSEPGPEQLQSVKAVITGKGPHARVGRIVLKAAGLLPSLT